MDLVSLGKISYVKIPELGNVPVVIALPMQLRLKPDIFLLYLHKRRKLLTLLTTMSSYSGVSSTFLATFLITTCFRRVVIETSSAMM